MKKENFKRTLTSAIILVLVVGMTGIPLPSAHVSAASSPLLKALVVIPTNTRRASVNSAGVEGTNPASNATVSTDGRYVAFESTANNLAAGDTDTLSDIFVHDFQTNETTLVSRPTGTTSKGNSHSYNPSISGDGRYVAFDSVATNLVANDLDGYRDVFIRDTLNNITTRVSISSSGDNGKGQNKNPSISANGRIVAFESTATNLVGGDTLGKQDIFVRNLDLGTTVRASVRTDGAQANNGSQNASISDLGRYVAFESNASNLVGSGDNNGTYDIFVRDLQSNITTLVSIASNGINSGSASSLYSSISADGRYVAFGSAATDLVSGDQNGQSDIFLRDRDADGNGIFDQVGHTTTTLISVSSSGIQGDGYSLIPSISADGRYIAFDSSATNLVTADSNEYTDIFLRDRVSNETIRLSVDSGGVEPSGDNSVNPAISSDGKFVSFESQASNLVSGDGNGVRDIFLVPASQEQVGYSRLDVSKVGSGGGTVSNPGGINCGTICLHWFVDTAVVQLSAVPDANSVFVGWSGEGCTGTGNCSVTMSTGRSVTATFDLLNHVYLPMVVR